MVRLLRASVAPTVVALLVASAPAAASAQAGGRQGGATAGATSNVGATEDTRRNEDDGFDPGWFGLLGLAGLFGLRRPREDHTTAARVDATPVTRRP